MGRRFIAPNTFGVIGGTFGVDRIWLVENVLEEVGLTSKEIACEQRFTDTCCCDMNGKFIVQLPN